MSALAVTFTEPPPMAPINFESLRTIKEKLEKDLLDSIEKTMRVPLSFLSEENTDTLGQIQARLSFQPIDFRKWSFLGLITVCDEPTQDLRPLARCRKLIANLRRKP